MQRGEVSHERGDVARTVAQWRHGQRNDVQPEEQIVAKRSLGDRAREILVRCCDDSHVHADRFPAAHAFDLLRLDGAQQLRLRLGSEIAHLVEKQRTRVRQLESADALVGRAGERALLVPEHFALDEVTRYRCAIHSHERAITARTGNVNGGRDELFAGTGFACDEDTGVGRSDA